MRTLNVNLAAIISLTAVLSIGCSSSDDDSSGTSESGPGGQMPATLTRYDGNYVEPCNLFDTEFPEEGYDVETYTISGNSGSLRILRYSDSGCSIPLTTDTSRGIVTETFLQVSITYPGGTTNTERGVADHVNLTVESVLLDGQAPDAQVQALLVQNGLYDIDYDIILLDGNSLYFGDASEETIGETPETRPTTLDPVFAVRQ